MASGLWSGSTSLSSGNGLWAGFGGFSEGGGLSPTGGSTPAQSVYNIAVMGQSEIFYIVAPAGPYNIIPQPTNVPSGVVTVYTQAVALGPIVTTPVTQAAATARSVNPAISAMTCALAYVLPGKSFHIATPCFSGTGRVDLGDDATDPDGRYWSDFTGMIAAAETGSGQPTDLLLECWYRSDSGFTANFVNAFWPLYFGSDGSGANFTLGTTNAVISRRVDHCIWDAQAATTAKGRGVFTRSDTKWAVLTPMSDVFAYPTDPPDVVEATNFTSVTSTMGAPRRQVIMDLPDNPLAASVGVISGPAPLSLRYDVSPGTDGGPTHPTTDPPGGIAGDGDGQVAFMWPFFAAIAREAGLTINEPYIESLEAATDGSWCDVLVRLPNNGTLTTRRILETRAAVSALVPHRQDVIGMEIGRSGSYRPVFNTAEVSYPANTRGTVTITDTGSGSPKRGKVRITPTTAFAFGDSIRYLAGGASGVLFTPRDIGVELDMLIETIPAYRDVTATYPFPGVAVRPLQTDTLVPVPAPPFTARAVYFDGGDYFNNESVVVPAGSDLLASMWIRSADTSWNATTRRIFQFRVSSTTTWELLTASSGRLTLRLNNNTATDTVSFTANGGATQFAINTWYHVMIAASGGTARVYVNNVAVATMTYATLDQAGTNLTRIGIGAQSPGTGPWIGDIGHMWISPTQTLDLTVTANREKFALAGNPVDLGSLGATPTGTQPEFYFDGAGAAWSNLGSFGSIPATGAVVATFTAPVVPAY